jgi:hypothetical protein
MKRETLDDAPAFETRAEAQNRSVRAVPGARAKAIMGTEAYRRLPPLAVRVLFALVAHADESGECYPSLRTIASLCLRSFGTARPGRSHEQVPGRLVAAIKTLVNVGIVFVTPRGSARGTTLYRIVWPVGVPVPQATGHTVESRSQYRRVATQVPSSRDGTDTVESRPQPKGEKDTGGRGGTTDSQESKAPKTHPKTHRKDPPKTQRGRGLASLGSESEREAREGGSRGAAA